MIDCPDHGLSPSLIVLGWENDAGQRPCVCSYCLVESERGERSPADITVTPIEED